MSLVLLALALLVKEEPKVSCNRDEHRTQTHILGHPPRVCGVVNVSPAVPGQDSAALCLVGSAVRATALAVGGGL